MISVTREFEFGDILRRTRAPQVMLDTLRQDLLATSIGIEYSAKVALMDARYLYHHAKLSMGDETAVLIPSANFSCHGLTTS